MSDLREATYYGVAAANSGAKNKAGFENLFNAMADYAHTGSDGEVYFVGRTRPPSTHHRFMKHVSPTLPPGVYKVRDGVDVLATQDYELRGTSSRHTIIEVEGQPPGHAVFRFDGAFAPRVSGITFSVPLDGRADYNFGIDGLVYENTSMTDPLTTSTDAYFRDAYAWGAYRTGVIKGGRRPGYQADRTQGDRIGAAGVRRNGPGSFDKLELIQTGVQYGDHGNTNAGLGMVCTYIDSKWNDRGVYCANSDLTVVGGQVQSCRVGFAGQGFRNVSIFGQFRFEDTATIIDWPVTSVRANLTLDGCYVVMDPTWWTPSTPIIRWGHNGTLWLRNFHVTHGRGIPAGTKYFADIGSQGDNVCSVIADVMSIPNVDPRDFFQQAREQSLYAGTSGRHFLTTGDDPMQFKNFYQFWQLDYRLGVRLGEYVEALTRWPPDTFWG